MPESKTEAALVAAHARLHALSWLVRHQQSLCDQLRRRLDASPELLEPPRGDPQSRATRLESHLQTALKALSACAVELAKRPEPDDADEYHELHDLTRRVASALDACAALAQAAPLANAAAGRGPQLHAASARKLQDAQARVERLASENAGLRATVKKLREQSRRSMGEVSEIESASEKQNALLRVELAIAKHKGREPSQLWQERSSERSEEKKQHHRRRQRSTSPPSSLQTPPVDVTVTSPPPASSWGSFVGAQSSGGKWASPEAFDPSDGTFDERLQPPLLTDVAPVAEDPNEAARMLRQNLWPPV